MLKIDVDFSAVQRELESLKRQMPYIISKTLNGVAYDARAEWQRQMAAKLDRPTRWALGSVRVTQATKQNLTAVVSMREGDYQPASALKQLFLAGGRAPKRFEVALRQQGFLGAGEFIVPGKAAPLDAYGNVKRSVLTQILQQIKAQPTRTTKRKRRSAVSGVFWSDGRRGLAKGAWAKGKDGSLRPMLLAVSAPVYRQFINLEPIAEKIAERTVQKHFDAAVRQAIATSR